MNINYAAVLANGNRFEFQDLLAECRIQPTLLAAVEHALDRGLTRLHKAEALPVHSFPDGSLLIEPHYLCTVASVVGYAFTTLN